MLYIFKEYSETWTLTHLLSSRPDWNIQQLILVELSISFLFWSESATSGGQIRNNIFLDLLFYTWPLWECSWFESWLSSCLRGVCMYFGYPISPYSLETYLMLTSDSDLWCSNTWISIKQFLFTEIIRATRPCVFWVVSVNSSQEICSYLRVCKVS